MLLEIESYPLCREGKMIYKVDSFSHKEEKGAPNWTARSSMNAHNPIPLNKEKN